MGNVLVCQQADRKGDSLNKETTVDKEIESDSFDDRPIPSITVINPLNKCPGDDAPGPADLAEFSSTGWANLISTNKPQSSKLFSAGPSHHLAPMHTENLHGQQTWTEGETFTQHENWLSTQSPSEILPTLFLGSKVDSMKDTRLKELKITHILSVTSGRQHVVPGCKLKTVAMADNGNSCLVDVMERSFGFIEESQQDGNKLLIHCHLGQNRSPTVVIAWLMKVSNITMHDAYVFVKTKRDIVHPHKLYIKQLREYDKRLFGVYSVLPDFLSVTVNDGQLKVAHENWTPMQSLEYRVSQKIDRSNESKSDLKSSVSESEYDIWEEKQSSMLGVSQNIESSKPSDKGAVSPLSSLSDAGFVQIADPTRVKSSKAISLRHVVNNIIDENCHSDSNKKDSATVSFQFLLGNVPEETPTISSE